MSIIDRFISQLAPHDCLGCGTEGSLLCSACQQLFNPVPERCYRCHEPSPGALTCATCYQAGRLHRLQAVAVYEGIAKQLIWKLKLAGAQTAATAMAVRLQPLIPIDRDILIVPVPTATGRVRRRGYDQAKLLARALSRQPRLPYLDCLTRSGQAHQHGASRAQRLQQLTAAFRVRRHNSIRGSHIMLIDDVVTTGATLEAAAAVLKAAGAARIEAVVFCAALGQSTPAI
jgi:ComF family protein